MVPPARLELTTCGLGIRRSIHLSYGGIRTLRILKIILWGLKVNLIFDFRFTVYDLRGVLDCPARFAVNFKAVILGYEPVAPADKEMEVDSFFLCRNILGLVQSGYHVKLFLQRYVPHSFPFCE